MHMLGPGIKQYTSLVDNIALIATLTVSFSSKIITKYIFIMKYWTGQCGLSWFKYLFGYSLEPDVCCINVYL